MLSKKEYRELIEEICCEKCKKDSYCILKELIIHTIRDTRVIVQIKCIEKYKWEESERQNCDIGWDEAGKKWVDNGYATKFATIYKEKDSIDEIYKKVMSNN